MTIFQALILALVEGITEFLPISSTGHLILSSHLLGITPSAFTSTFVIVIQSGAVLAVIIYFSQKIKSLTSLFKPGLIAFLPTALVGFLLYPLIKGFLLQNSVITAITLIAGGIFFILYEKIFVQKLHSFHEQEVTLKRAFIIGCCQALAVVPGVSRSAATIIAGVVQGISKKRAVEFSFLLSIPTLGFATLYDLKKTAMVFTNQEFLLLVVGIIGACISSLVTIKWFLKFVENHSFVSFGIYRIIVGLLFLILIVGFNS